MAEPEVKAVVEVKEPELVPMHTYTAVFGTFFHPISVTRFNIGMITKHVHDDFCKLMVAEGRLKII